jgi:hypothetical protein
MTELEKWQRRKMKPGKTSLRIQENMENNGKND